MPKAHQDPFAGEILYGDVKTYFAFGEHRTGDEADSQTSEWIADRLKKAGLKTEFLSWKIRQFILNRHSLEVDGQQVTSFPLWFPKATGQVPITAPLTPFIEAEQKGAMRGKIVFSCFQRGYPEEGSEQERVIFEAARAGAVGVVGLTETGEKFPERLTLNVLSPYNQQAWPLPVMWVADKHRDFLAAAAERGATTSLLIDGHTEEAVTARNVIGRLERGKDLIMVNTPQSGWLGSAGERGNGIALFLSLAAWSSGRDSNTSYLFTSNPGHEIGHIGQHHSLQAIAPPPDEVKCYLHLGSACGAVWDYRSGPHGVSKSSKAGPQNLTGVPEFVPILKRTFTGLPNLNPQSEFLAGELKDAIDIGYRAFGIFGAQYYAHTYDDTPDVTAPELLEPVARALGRTFEEIEEM